MDVPGFKEKFPHVIEDAKRIYEETKSIDKTKRQLSRKYRDPRDKDEEKKEIMQHVNGALEEILELSTSISFDFDSSEMQEAMQEAIREGANLAAKNAAASFESFVQELYKKVYGSNDTANGSGSADANVSGSNESGSVDANESGSNESGSADANESGSNESGSADTANESGPASEIDTPANESGPASEIDTPNESGPADESIDSDTVNSTKKTRSKINRGATGKGKCSTTGCIYSQGHEGICSTDERKGKRKRTADQAVVIDDTHQEKKSKLKDNVLHQAILDFLLYDCRGNDRSKSAITEMGQILNGNSPIKLHVFDDVETFVSPLVQLWNTANHAEFIKNDVASTRFPLQEHNPEMVYSKWGRRYTTHAFKSWIEPYYKDGRAFDSGNGRQALSWLMQALCVWGKAVVEKKITSRLNDLKKKSRQG